MAMINLYSANVIGNKWNCLYPNLVEVNDEKSLMAAVIRDYVCAEYKGNYRSKDNFISSDCLPVDCDNDHSENPAEWIPRMMWLRHFRMLPFSFITVSTITG